MHAAFEVHAGRVELDKSLIYVCMGACLYTCVVLTLHPSFSPLRFCDTVLLELRVADETL